MTHRVTVIVLESNVRRELMFSDVQSNGIEFNSDTATLTLWTEKGSMLNTRWVVPFVSHYAIEDELQW